MRLIDADALKEEINKKRVVGRFNTLLLIDNAPTVELKRVKNELNNELNELRPQGEWKLHGMIYYCSVCGHDYEQGGNNFCGNCGARMKRGGAE